MALVNWFNTVYKIYQALVQKMMDFLFKPGRMAALIDGLHTVMLVAGDLNNYSSICNKICNNNIQQLLA